MYCYLSIIYAIQKCNYDFSQVTVRLVNHNLDRGPQLTKSSRQHIKLSLCLMRALLDLRKKTRSCRLLQRVKLPTQRGCREKSEILGAVLPKQSKKPPLQVGVSNTSIQSFSRSKCSHILHILHICILSVCRIVFF